MLNKTLNLAIANSLLLLTGCATIMHGTRQTVGVSSNPTNASVWVDQRFMGSTPLVVEMSRNQNHILRIELDGYEPYEAAFTKQVSGWVFGNVVFGGIIGLAVDACTGGIYSLTPDQVQAEMRNGNIAYSKKSDDSYIAIVLKADPSWQKVGNLVSTN